MFDPLINIFENVSNRSLFIKLCRMALLEIADHDQETSCRAKRDFDIEYGPTGLKSFDADDFPFLLFINLFDVSFRSYCGLSKHPTMPPRMG